MRIARGVGAFAMLLLGARSLRAQEGSAEAEARSRELSERMRVTLERVWLRGQQFAAKSGTKKTVLRPKQEQLLHLLRERRGLAPSEIWAALDVTKQGAAYILAPLLKAKLVRRIGTRKSGRYVLA